MVALYAATIFVSAALLFVVQPMFARMVLPVLGGSPAVWNTAMVFYQAALLAGYAYAHATTSRLGARKQAVLHVVVLILPLAVLPIALPAGWTPPAQSNPAPWLLAMMTVAVGLPFFAVSATSPVLQRWFAATGHARAADPYFLYAASNLGSMLALLAYPLWLEPQLRLGQQSEAWRWGYYVFVALMAACAVRLWVERGASKALSADGEQTSALGATRSTLTARRRARWVLLAFVPSSLLLGVTTYLSSEVAVVPLLWVVPLALYLLTFILVFAQRPLVPRPLLVRALPIAVAPLVVACAMQATEPIGPLMLLHLAVFFIAAMLCHGELAADRPAAAHLTEFYLWLSVGGVLGGACHALLAPLLFDSIAEYPLALVLACAVALPRAEHVSRGDWLWPLLPGTLTAGAVWAVRGTRFHADAVVAGLLFGVPALVAFFLSRRPLRFALAVGAILFAATFYEGEKGRVLAAGRSFFGVHRVTLDPTGSYHLLAHGKTLHGAQSLDPARRRESLAYYHRTGPAADVLAIAGRGPGKKIGLVGLGVGSLAAFAEPGQAWTYFEIDPVVEKYARDPRYFSFLRDSPATPRVVLGDARLTLAHEPDARFDVLILDAYSSDAIPVHLVTREALALYRRKLAPGGVLAFHISNLHLELEPVFANLARDAQLTCLTRDDTEVPDALRASGKAPSVWLVMAPRADELAPLARDARWRPGRVDANLPVWTDDYSSLWRVFRWR
jgi:hypothetical protein